MYLGTVAPTREELEALIERAQQRVRQITATASNGAKLAVRYSVLSYPDYLRALARFDRHEQELHRWRIADDDQRARMMPPSPAVIGFVLLGRSRSRTPDEAGWKAYLHEVAPGFADKLASMYRPSAFPAVHRNRHTFIVAPTGQGKSELLKALVWHDVQHPGASVIVLDPGGVMCRQIARWPELLRSDRLVYVEPELRHGMTVGINPFAGGHQLDERTQSAVAGTIAQVLGELSANLTPNMQTLARFCCLALLSVPNATLHDLGLLVQKPRAKNERIVRSFDFEDDKESDVFHERRQHILQAAFYHQNQHVRGFFRNDFDSPEYLGTRGWLKTRIDRIASMSDLRDALFGMDTLRLGEAMDGGKVVVVNLRQFGEDEERATVGRLFVGLVAALGQRRGRLPDDTQHRPVHLIVDEATEVVSPQMVVILEQLRKFGIHLTLAQQVGGRNFTSEQKEVLFQNTRTKIIAHENKREGAALLGFQGDPERLPTLADFQFWVRWHTDTEIRHLAVRSDLADRSHTVSDEEWQQFAHKAVASYYRPSATAPGPGPLRPAVQPKSAPVAPAPEPSPGTDPAPKRARKPAASPLPPRPKGPRPEPGTGSAKPGGRLPKL